jgi:hypothetical protein
VAGHYRAMAVLQIDAFKMENYKITAFVEWHESHG